MELSLEYIAGFFDGEGYVGISRQKKKDRPNATYWIKVIVGQGDPRVPTYLHSRYGGTLYIDRAPTRKRPLYRWQAHANKALRFLEEVHPHLIVKREHAELAIAFQKLRYGNKPLHGIEARRRIWELNGRYADCEPLQ